MGAGYAVLFSCVLAERDEGGLPVGVKSPRQGCGCHWMGGSRALDSMGFKVLRRRRPLPLPASGVLACF